MNWRDVATVTAVTLLVAVLVALFGYVVHVEEQKWRACMDAGFPEQKGDYCVKRENGTDLVVHVDRVRGR
jgi:hypothetical protein